MQELTELIRTELDDKNTVFVFPSEIVANFWQHRILSNSSRRLIALRQLISWDTFKNQCFLYPTTGQPVTQQDRLLFLSDFFSRNRRTPFLSAIIPPHFAGNANIYLKKYLGILPALHNVDLPEFQPASGRISPQKMADLKCLKKKYQDFLTENDLYDPHFLIPELRQGEAKYILCYPELQPEYAALAPALSSHQRIRIIPVPEVSASSRGEIKIYENSLQEIEQLMLTLTSLLDRGVPPTEIIITAANPEELEDYLTSQAAIHAIPLYFHAATALGNYPAARLIHKIQECFAESFTLPVLKNLLLTQALPWKDSQLNRNLLAFGVHYKCIERGSQAEDPWLRNFSKARQSPRPGNSPVEELKTFYLTLKHQIMTICRAQSFRRLHTAMEEFLETFFTPRIRTAEAYRPLQFALELLALLEATASYLKNTSVQNPFSLWLQALDLQPYTQGGQPHKIAVYPYRVSAGINPAYHFILNTSQQGTRHMINNYPFLSPSEQHNLANKEQDLSRAYLDLYTISGQEVHFSFARRSFKDTNIIPGRFMAEGTVVDAASSLPEEIPSFRRERTYWQPAPAPAPTRVFPVQKDSLEKAAITCAVLPEHDYTKTPLTNPQQIRFIKEHLSRDNNLYLSPSSLEKFNNCPFDFMLAKGLGLKETDYEPVMVDRRELGTIMHRIFHRFYTNLNSQKSLPMEATREDEYREILETSCREIFSEKEVSEPVPVLPCWDSIKTAAGARGQAFITEEIKNFPHFTTLATEQELEVPWQGHDIILHGKLDRISRAPELLAVIDYKRNHTHTRREIFSPEPVSFQMPFYVYLLETNRTEKVAIAAYYIIEKEKFEYILHPRQKAMVPRDEMDMAIERMKETIEGVVEKLDKGDYRPPASPFPETCRYCLFRTVCRKHYLTG